jgi:hypothetical protein
MIMSAPWVHYNHYLPDQALPAVLASSDYSMVTSPLRRSLHGHPQPPLFARFHCFLRSTLWRIKSGIYWSKLLTVYCCHFIVQDYYAHTESCESIFEFNFHGIYPSSLRRCADPHCYQSPIIVRCGPLARLGNNTCANGSDIDDPEFSFVDRADDLGETDDSEGSHHDSTEPECDSRDHDELLVAIDDTYSSTDGYDCRRNA